MKTRGSAEITTLCYYAEMERGQRSPTIKLLYELAEILDVCVVDLLDVGEERSPVKLAEVTAEPPPRGRKPKQAKKRTKA